MNVKHVLYARFTLSTYNYTTYTQKHSQNVKKEPKKGF
jgi:hypothetical protein